MTTGGPHPGLGCPWLLRLLLSLLHFTADPGEQAVPHLHFTPARTLHANLLVASLLHWGASLLPLTYFPQQKVVGTRRTLGSPRPAPENSPPPPTNCNPVAGIQCRSNSISGLLSRQHNLSPGSPPIIGTQICRHRELIGGIKEEVVFGVSCGHSSARAMLYLLWSCCARPADPGLCAQLPAGYTQRGFHPPECHVFN